LKTTPYLLLNIALLVGLCCLLFACKKDTQASTTPPDVVTPVITPVQIGLYSDSVFFMQAVGKTVKPLATTAGSFTSVPDGLSINNNTGEIDANNSETGLRYRVTFTPTGGGTAQTSTVIISGINYADKIYNLSKGDSIAAPIYNANALLTIPGANSTSVFDQGGGCKKAGIAVGAGNAIINLALSVRNQGIDTGATQQVKLAYRISDGSNSALNGLDVKIYFYRTAAEIPQYLTDLLAARKAANLSAEGQKILSLPGQPMLATQALAVNKAATPVKARPPCIIVISR